MKFVVSGKIKISGGRPFKKEIDAQSEKDAREKTYALFGSSNGLKREQIQIETVEKV
ncbi:50S ribosomal protein L18a [Candidatus Micrarchaeota archaeon]|nr:50S ribosomal protein L18a [Candidatus Micrarchaeota archaeon]